MTSSIAAVIYGHDLDDSKVFDENFWSRTDADIGAYEKSKTLAEHAWMQEIAEILNKHFASQGYKIPTRKLPNIVIRLAALFDKTVRLAVDHLVKRYEISNERIQKVLEWKPRSLEEMVSAMGKSMIEQGVV